GGDRFAEQEGLEFGGQFRLPLRRQSRRLARRERHHLRREERLGRSGDGGRSGGILRPPSSVLRAPSFAAEDWIQVALHQEDRSGAQLFFFLGVFSSVVEQCAAAADQVRVAVRIAVEDGLKDGGE